MEIQSGTYKPFIPSPRRAIEHKFEEYGLSREMTEKDRKMLDSIIVNETKPTGEQK